MDAATSNVEPLEGEEEDEKVPNAHRIKRKATTWTTKEQNSQTQWSIFECF